MESSNYIRAVLPLKDFRLFLEMESGSTVTVDLSGKLRTLKYALLQNPTLFRDVRTDGNNVSWGDGRVQASARELLDIALIGEYTDDTQRSRRGS